MRGATPFIADIKPYRPIGDWGLFFREKAEWGQCHFGDECLFLLRGKLHRRTKGPVPDRALWPIRGPKAATLDKTVAAEAAT